MAERLLFTPMKIGSCEIKNRIVMAPMLMGFGRFDGTPTDALIDYYEARAKGGAGLIVTEITRVNDVTGAGAFAQLSMSRDANIEPMRRFADRIHAAGSKLFVQLHHPGRQNVGLLVGTLPLSIAAEGLTRGGYGKLLYKLTPKVGPKMLAKNIVPHSVAPSKCDPAYFAGGRVRELKHKEIKALEQDFINAAVRVQKAGCDGVMLHASHGYLIQQFFSPVTNRRTDEYGGSLENRLRFIRNVIAGIRAQCGPDFPLVVRLTADECYDRLGLPGKGYGLEEGVAIAKALEQYGVDAIDVSSAGYDAFNYWLEPMSFEPGWRKHMAKAVKEAVSIPVIAANLIRSPEQAEQQLEEGVQDFISLGRPHIADPDWARKAETGGTIRRCICCLNCIESMEANAFVGGHGLCAVNPFVGNEGKPFPTDGNGRKVLVAGGGPGGLTAAYLAAKRGFDVTLYEQDDAPGGQLRLAETPPHKEKIGWFIEDITALCREAGANLVFGKKITAQELADQHPYAVINATGSEPIKPVFGGRYEYGDLLTFKDVLSGSVTLRDKNVVIAGSGMTGLETAEYLGSLGNRVTVIEMVKTVAPGTWMQHVDDILPRLKSYGVQLKTGEKLSEVYPDSVITENVDTGVKTNIPADAVVLALGSRPVPALAEELKKRGVTVYNIGDSKKAGRIQNATGGAYDAVMSL